jgi:hypothetical protein
MSFYFAVNKYQIFHYLLEAKVCKFQVIVYLEVTLAMTKGVDDMAKLLWCYLDHTTRTKLQVLLILYCCYKH